MIWRSLLRTIRKSLGRYLAIMSIIGLGVGFFSGLRVTESAILKTADKYINELNLYDFRLVSTLGFTDEDADAFDEIDGISASKGGYSADVIYTAQNGSDAVLHAKTLFDGINGVDLLCGRLPVSADECILDSKCAGEDMLGKKTVFSDTNGGETTDKFAYGEYTVVGIVNSSEYINFERGTTPLAGGSVSGFMYLLPEGFDMEAYTEIYLSFSEKNEIYSDEYLNLSEKIRPEVQKTLDARAKARYDELYMDAKAEIDRAQEELDEKKAQAEAAEKQLGLAAANGVPEEALAEDRESLAQSLSKISEAQEEIDSSVSELNETLKPATVYLLDRTSNAGYAGLENDTAIVKGVAKVFPLFFFLIAALVCITTMTRMISESRTQIGIYKALGYRNGTVAAQYLFYAGSASVIGCITGFLLGSRFLPMALWEVYRIMYSIERPIEFVLDFSLFALCFAIYMFCALGATYFVCAKDLRESAAQLIRPKSPSAGKRVFLERIGFIWKRLKFLHKISIRNILRYKKRMVMMIIGIGGCTALLLTGFGIRDSIQPVTDYQYNEIFLYDASVVFTEEANEERQARFAEDTKDKVQSIAFVSSHSAHIPGSKDGELNLTVFDGEPGEFIDLHRKDEQINWPKDGEAVINRRLAEENGINVGDMFTAETDGGEPEKIQVRISGIFDNYIYNYVFINSQTYRDSTGKDAEINLAYVNFKEDADMHEAGAALLSAENTASVTLSSDMQTRVGNMLQSLDYIVLIVLVCAGTLAFIVLYNLTNITITERTREIATLKVLGFYIKEQNSYVFRENIVLTGVSALCGIPMGIALLYYVMEQIKISSVYFIPRLSPVSYLLAVAITFVFTLTVDLTMTAKTKRIDMAGAMKAVE